MVDSKNAVKLGEQVAELNDIVEQTYWLEQKIYELSQKVEKNKEVIKKSLGKKNRLSVRVDDVAFDVRHDTAVKLEFYAEQLEQNLDKEMYEKCIDKSIEIRDLPTLIKVLKSYGVPAKEFKKFIKSNAVASPEKIDRLIEIGELEIGDLHGCYKADFTDTISVRKTK